MSGVEPHQQEYYPPHPQSHNSVSAEPGLQAMRHVISEIIKPKLGVGTIGDIGLIAFLRLVVPGHDR